MNYSNFQSLLIRAAIPLREFAQRDSSNPCGWTLNRHAAKSLEGVDMIWGYNLDNGGLCVFYGRELVDRCRAAGKSEKAKIITIAYHGDTEELEALCAVTKLATGTMEYEGTEHWLDEMCDKLFNINPDECQSGGKS
jgi:hypothetical protein